MDQVHILIFRLDQQAFAFSIDAVTQIIDMVAILPLPKADPTFEGVINLHGRMLPVINLRRILYDTPCPCGLHTPILLVKIDGQMTGLIVDEVLDVAGLPSKQIATPADFLPPGIRSIPILKGLASAAKETVILLEPDHLLDRDQGKALSEMIELLQNFYRPGIAARDE